MLRSEQMQLSAAERRWLPWFGRTGKIAMRWATSRNRHRYPAIEQTFESFAATRVRILTGWCTQQWGYLEGLAREVAAGWPQPERELLLQYRQRAVDFSELFIVDPAGKVLASSHAGREGGAPPRRRRCRPGCRGSSCTAPTATR